MTKAPRLFALFQPKHYDLTLDPDRDSLKLTGTVAVTGQKTGRPSQRLTFHQKGVRVTSASIIRHDKKGDQAFPVSRINHHASRHEVRLHCGQLLYPGSYTVRMEFTGRVSSGMTGVYYSDYQVDDKTKRMVSTQFENVHAREAFPCIDEPEAKATFDVTLLSPVGEAVIGNMPVRSQKEKNGQLVTVFETTPKISTYLVALAYGDLQHKTKKTKSGATVSVWATKAHRPAALDFGLDTAVRALEFFERFFGTPYPLPKLDNLAVPDFAAAGMENWGLITYREMAVLADPATTAQSSRELIAEVICHEVAHQWFGDLVTMKWWDEVWLNESFANVMAFVAMDELFPEWHVWDSYTSDDGLAAIRRDAVPGVQAVKAPINNPEEINSIFDPSIVYAKGGRMINLAMNYVGREVFGQGLKIYFAKHAYGNTTSDDLWAALSAASHKEVSNLMTPWLFRPGFPVITATQQGSQLSLEQEHFSLDPAKADPQRLWPVALLCETPGVPELLESRSLDIKLKDPGSVHLNREAVGHYLVHYAQPAHAAAIAERAGKKQLSVAERLMLLNDSAMLARAGTISFGDTLHLLEHYTDEDNDAVWGVMGLILADARRFIDLDARLETPIKALIRKLVAKQYQRLGHQEIKGEPSQDVKLRGAIMGLGVYAEHPEVLKQALTMYETYRKQPDGVAPELRAVALGAAIRSHTKGAFDYLLKLDESSPAIDLKEDLIAALSLTRQKPEAEILLSRLQNAKKVRQHDVDRWLIYLMRNRHVRDLAWRWLGDNWPWIEKTFAGDLHYDNFPRYAASAFNTRQQLKEYKVLFGPLREQTALKRNIDLGIEELETRAAWLERDLVAVKQFFKNK